MTDYTSIIGGEEDERRGEGNNTEEVRRGRVRE